MSPGSRPPSAVRESVSGTTSNAIRPPRRATTVRQTPATETESPTRVRGGLGRRDDEARAVEGCDGAELEDDAREHAAKVTARAGTPPTGRLLRTARCASGAARAARRGRRAKRGPSPARTGATKRSSLSTKPAARNAVASVGPPSSSSDCTPSAASARELLVERRRCAARAPSRRAAGRARTRAGAAGVSAPTSRASRRGAVGAHRSHPDRDRVRWPRAARARAAATPRPRPSGDPEPRRDRRASPRPCR